MANQQADRWSEPRRRSRRAMLALALGAIALSVNHASASAPAAPAGPVLFQVQETPAPRVYQTQFKTGYEVGETVALPPLAHTWMVFQNTSTHPLAWPWAMPVYYETPGGLGDRYARIIPDPTGTAGNRVLHYWLKNAVIDAGFLSHTKGRIQTDFPDELVDAFEVYGRQRMYIHPDFNLLHSYPPGGDPWWLDVNLQEIWSNKAWLGQPNPSRIGLSMFSLAGQMHLYMRCHSAVDTRVFWQETNLSYVLPVGEWVTLEVGYKMGDATSGRMVLVVTRESTGQRDIVFNVTDWTFDPLALLPGGPGPIPMNGWNPQKIYASDNVIHHVRDQGGVAQVYWDDFAFSGMWPPAWP